jgi:hypothetical protein
MSKIKIKYQDTFNFFEIDGKTRTCALTPLIGWCEYEKLNQRAIYIQWLWHSVGIFWSK